MTRRALFLATLLCLGLSSPAPAQNPSPSLEALQARYDRLTGLRATFTQVTKSEFADDSTRIQGRVLLAGNKYRVETPSQTVVTNDSTTWIYSPADSQVVVNDTEANATTVTPQTFLTASGENYEVVSTRSARRDGAPHDVLSLSATGPSARFKEAVLWVRRGDRIVTRLRATDRNGAILELRLYDIEVDPGFENRPFSFSAPEGVEVVDLRSDASG
jgi:outer membrane lipoprotein carrier protein